MKNSLIKSLTLQASIKWYLFNHLPCPWRSQLAQNEALEHAWQNYVVSVLTEYQRHFVFRLQFQGAYKNALRYKGKITKKLKKLLDQIIKDHTV